ncbi:MAG TPA: hypothetical protein IAB64_04805 [Candidatus Coproplasma excrementavium]|nr:hypothetical protein [Candidatus Coproplasma excrementavium]
MSQNKLLVIIISSFVAAALVCIAVGLGLYFTAINLPASAEGRGVRVLAGVVVLAVGGISGIFSLAALAVVLIKHFISGKK